MWETNFNSCEHYSRLEGETAPPEFEPLYGSKKETSKQISSEKRQQE